MTEDEAFDRLRAFLVAIDAEARQLDPTHPVLTDVIASHQNGPRVEGPYGLITAIGTRDAGQGARITYGTATIDGQERVTELHDRAIEHMMRVDFYAPRATDYGRLLRAALLSSRGRLDFLPAAVAAVSEVQAGPELVQQHWEGRAHLTVTLGARATETILIDVIESGHVSLEGDGAAPVATEFDYQKGAP